MPPSHTIAGYYASLCSVAMEFGFYNCEPLRALPENQEYLNRPVVPGDIVYIPDRTDSEFSKPVDNRHNFTVKAALPPSIRIVKGVGSNPGEDFERNSIPVSNYVTTKQGATASDNFSTTHFYVPSLADPDAFRVEVYDPAASGTVNVKLEALKPSYTFDRHKLTPYGWKTSSEPGRSIPALACQANGGTFSHHFTSKYLRLVVDEADLNAPGLSNQLLFVSDYVTGPGDGGSKDPARIEILHQQIRATYELPRCPGHPKCAISTVLPVAENSTIRKFKLRVFAFQNTAAGEQNTSLGVPLHDAMTNIRRRVYKWCRRAFAQVGLTPSLDFYQAVIPVPPPGENMMCLSHGHGRPVAPAGAQLTFKLVRENQTEPVPVQVVFEGGDTPYGAGYAIEKALPEGFSTSLNDCWLSSDPDCPAEIVIFDKNSKTPPRIIDVQLSEGAGLTVDVPRVNLKSVIVDDDSRAAAPPRLSLDLYRILRDREEWSPEFSNDVIDIIVVEGFNTPSLQGIVFPPYESAPENTLPGWIYENAIVIPANCAAGATLDGSDNLPYLLPGLIAQVLGDMRLDLSDPHAANSLLNPATSTANSVTATKRLPDEPLGTKIFPAGTMKGRRVHMSERLRSAGSGKLSSW